MNTPISSFIKSYAERNALRLHMPGHKGKGDIERFDITEIDGADVLYSAGGIIKQSEQNASALFGSGKTFYSTEGSSLAIRAMLYLLKRHSLQSGKRPSVLAGRNAHKTFLTAAALLDIEVDWILSEETSLITECNITPECLKGYLGSINELPSAVYITTPDYVGNMLDVKGISEVCREFGVLLLVDNAHGAYLRFLKESLHPINCGADMCCDSAHKTLPALTGCAYLHISKDAPSDFAENAEQALSFFASTSPSYLLLDSLDRVNAYLADGYAQKLNSFIGELDKLRERISDLGFELCGNEPLKITVAPKSFGYTGTELAELLRSENIECEFADPDITVMMFTPELTTEELTYIYNVLASLERRQGIEELPPSLTKRKRVMSLNEAIFSKAETLPIDKCIGRVAADISVSCPPAVPIVICGEEIDRNAASLLKYYGAESCRVIK